MRSTALAVCVLSALCNYPLSISLLLKHLPPHVAQHGLVTYVLGLCLTSAEQNIFEVCDFHQLLCQEPGARLVKVRH